MYTDHAIKIIQNHNKTTPLLLYLPYQNTHGPLQAPKDEIEKFKDLISNVERRIYAAMMKTLDDAVGHVSLKITFCFLLQRKSKTRKIYG